MNSIFELCVRGDFWGSGLKEDQLRGENYSLQRDRGENVLGAVLKGCLGLIISPGYSSSLLPRVFMYLENVM
jgi:hypothetical protein